MKFFIALSALVVVINSNVIPTKIYMPCMKSDPYLSKCFKEQIEKARPFAEIGISEIGLPPIDPHFVKEYEVKQALSDTVWMRATVRNAVTTGYKNTILGDLKVDLDKGIVDVTLTTPLLNLKMEYEVKGQVLVVPLQSEGYFEGNFTNIKSFVRSYLKLANKNGVDYYTIDKLQFVSRVGDGHVMMTSKNPDMQFAAEGIAEFYNQNPRLFMDAINPIYVRTGAVFLKNTLNEILSHIPANEFFA